MCSCFGIFVMNNSSFNEIKFRDFEVDFSEDKYIIKGLAEDSEVLYFEKISEGVILWNWDKDKARKCDDVQNASAMMQLFKTTNLKHYIPPRE